MRTGFDSVDGEPLQVRWNRKIKNNLYAFIPSFMDFGQSIFRVAADGDEI